MGFDLNVTVPALTVFFQGLLSFLSPCILPIIPLYMGYLSGGNLSNEQDGFNRKKVMINTLFFVIGISFAFFILGLGVSAAGQFFTQNQMLFSRIGGILVILLGLVQLGVLDKPFRGREFKLPIKINALKMNAFTALLMGFVFSFAWTPCVGPALSTVLIMVSSANSMVMGLILMGVYTLGFTIPFLIVGMFTTECLKFFSKHRNVVAYTVKIGGALMILMGIMMFTGIMNSVTSYLSTFDIAGTIDTVQDEQGDTEEATDELGDTADTEENADEQSDTADTGENADEQGSTADDTEEKFKALDFELQDQFGNTHVLSDYEGKVVFLNFWATWCPPCREEMPDIQSLYENYGLNEEDVVILGVASPLSDENPNTRETDEESVKAFLESNNYTYPVVMDNGDLSRAYGFTALPSTILIDKDGNLFGYIPGMMTYSIMETVIEDTLAG